MKFIFKNFSISDNLQFKGEPLWINLLMKAAKKSDNVRVFLTNTWKETFERRYPMLAKFDMHFNEVDSIYDIDSVKLESDGNRRLAYFIDSIDRDFLDFGEKIVAHLAQLSSKFFILRLAFHFKIISNFFNLKIFSYKIKKVREIDKNFSEQIYIIYMRDL